MICNVCLSINCVLIKWLLEQMSARFNKKLHFLAKPSKIKITSGFANITINFKTQNKELK